MFQQQVPFVGRDADLRLFEFVLGRAAAGTGSVVLISGEAGTGKTRLCQELSRSHRGRGGQVLLGRASPDEAAISFGAIADALRTARRGEPPLWRAALARPSVLWTIARAGSGARGGAAVLRPSGAVRGAAGHGGRGRR